VKLNNFVNYSTSNFPSRKHTTAQKNACVG